LGCLDCTNLGRPGLHGGDEGYRAMKECSGQKLQAPAQADADDLFERARAVLQ